MYMHEGFFLSSTSIGGTISRILVLVVLVLVELLYSGTNAGSATTHQHDRVSY